TVSLPGGQGTAWHGQALLPAGRDLLVLHAQVNTGLDHPVSGGGYGGSVSEPINLVATVLRSGRAPLVPPNAESMLTDRLEVPDVSGVALSGGALFLASRIKGQVERVPLRAGGRLDTRNRSVVAALETESSPHGKANLFDQPPGTLAAGNGTTGLALDGDRVITFAAFDRVLVSASSGGGPRVEVSLGAGRLDAQLARGRRLFFRNDKAISSAHLACASCHVDGREDGLVWRLQGGRLQTPSLAGRLEDTAPYNWHGTTRTLPDNIAQTIERLGGGGLDRADREALARYLTEGLRPVRTAPTGDRAMVAQGRTLFHDRTVGCSSCHDSASGFTDGEAHDVESLSRAEREELTRTAEQARVEPSEEDKVEGLLARTANKAPAPTVISSAFDTPALRQLALTAPYFHDGSAKTLEELVDGNRDRMGRTSHLSTDERRALVAYLRTL
ncbi:MAG TPA: cytochrome c peroxidase, partial [Myxococcales bacterium]|nr:cytochrome c peroxidase [Myxococcales bacterium]